MRKQQQLRASAGIGVRDEVLVMDWPAWATEPVAVLPPDPGWRELGEQECRLLEVSLARWLVAGVEHVGSTDREAYTAGKSEFVHAVLKTRRAGHH